MIRTLVLAALLATGTLSGAASFAESHTVRGHVTKKGVYVPPHHRTNPDSTIRNNWSTKPNVNPYTGKPGKIDPYKPPRKSR